ncbi:outer membrane protein [Sphingopyxis terrae]|nr:outer membrane beta-barrel protein [Sphingopyxis terrae]
MMTAAFAATLFAVPAHAQDSSGLAGFKLGAIAGYDSVKLELDGDSGSKGGFAYGLTAGYDVDLGGAILGIETEISDSTAEENVSDVVVPGDRASLVTGRDLYVGARIGFAASDNVLLFAKGGYTNARVKLKYNDGTSSLTEGDNLDGYRLGGGAEYVSGPIFGRLEYRYSDYGEYSYAGVGTGLKASRHQVVFAGGYRF